MTGNKFCSIVECFTCISSDSFDRKLEKYFASVRIWHYKSVEISVCVTELEFSSSACDDEVIILSLPCHLSASCFSSLFACIKENSRNGSCSTSLFSK